MSKSVQHPAYLKKLFSFIEKDAKKNGINAVQNFFKKTKVIPKSFFLSQETFKILKTKPCIVIVNHPHYIEFLVAVNNLPQRKDMFLVITDSCLGLIPSLDKNLIPVHIQHHGPENIVPKKIDFGHIFFFTPAKKTPQEITDYNRKNIDIGVKKVNDGGVLLICPQGLKAKGGSWFNGIGFIVSKMKKEKEIYIINTHIEGTSPWDIFRVIPFASKFLPKIKIAFDKPLLVKEIINKKPKEIKKYLEKKYNKWVKSFSFS